MRVGLGWVHGALAQQGGSGFNTIEQAAVRIYGRCANLALGLSINELVEGKSPPPSEPKDGPRDMLEGVGGRGGVGGSIRYASMTRAPVPAAVQGK